MYYDQLDELITKNIFNIPNIQVYNYIIFQNILIYNRSLLSTYTCTLDNNYLVFF